MWMTHHHVNHFLHCEVLRAALVINRYVQNINDLLARRVKAVLGSLGCQTRYEAQLDKVESKITDFFEHA